MPVQGLHLIKPTSIAATGASSSSSINTNGSVAFTTCATLSLNGVFSDNYDNYMIVSRLKWDSAGTDNLYFRLRATGTDNSTASSYVYQQLFAGATTVSGSRTTSNTSYIAAVASTQRDGVIINIYGPYLSQATAYRSVNVCSENNAAIFDYAGSHNQSTAYDGFTIYPTSSSITGLICVYGMRK